MSNTNSDDIKGLLTELANSQLNTQQQLDNLVEHQDIAGQQILQLTDVVNQLTNDISSVTARNAVLNEIIPELRESQERQELLTTEVTYLHLLEEKCRLLSDSSLKTLTEL